jgi:phytoene/squalene synthetase
MEFSKLTKSEILGGTLPEFLLYPNEDKGISLLEDLSVLAEAYHLADIEPFLKELSDRSLKEFFKISKLLARATEKLNSEYFSNLTKSLRLDPAHSQEVRFLINYHLKDLFIAPFKYFERGMEDLFREAE